jgi:HAD superfamily phosphatase (TIGR01668 family)
MWRIVTPDLRIESVLELDVPRLRSLDLSALLLDVDSTLKEYRAEHLEPRTEAWLSALRAAGIGLCLVSNGRAKRIRRLAEGLSLPVICQACKPLPFGCRAALRKTGFDRRRTAIVGDQLFADVVAGRLAGLACILVQPVRPEEEHWYTRIKRPWERWLLARIDADELRKRAESGCKAGSRDHL